MVLVDNVSKLYKNGGEQQVILRDITLSLHPNDKFVVFGHRSSGKTTLIKIVAGLLIPTKGRVVRSCQVSYPVGHLGGFRGELTIAQNVAFAAALYGADGLAVRKTVAELVRLKSNLDLVWEETAPTKRREVGFALSYALPFDFYLVDGNFVNGSLDFQAACLELIQTRMQVSGVLFTTRSARPFPNLNMGGAVLYGSRLRILQSAGEALNVYRNTPTPRNTSGFQDDAIDDFSNEKY